MNSSSGLPEQYWELVEQYRAELIADAMSIVGAREDAEDVVQETFCEAFKQPEKLTNAASIRALLLSINRCNTMDRARNKKRDSHRIIRKLQNDPGEMATTGGFSGLERADFVAGAIEGLPAKMRSVVVLHYFQHLTYKEIAGRLKMPPGTVGRLLYEASQVLYSKLEIHVDRANAKNPPPPKPPEPTGEES